MAAGDLAGTAARPRTQPSCGPASATRRIVVLGAREAVGASSTAVALALTLAGGGAGTSEEGDGVLLVDAAARPAARGLLTGRGHGEERVDVRRYCPPRGGRPGDGPGTDFASATAALARRRAWLITDAAPSVAVRDPAGILAAADDLVLVTSAGTAGARAADAALDALHDQGLGALASRCVLVLTGARDAGRPIGRHDMWAYFEEHCGAVIDLPRALAPGWPWSRRALRELAYLLMPVTEDDEA